MNVIIDKELRLRLSYKMARRLELRHGQLVVRRAVDMIFCIFSQKSPLDAFHSNDLHHN